METATKSAKYKLYNAYVSSGQAGHNQQFQDAKTATNHKAIYANYLINNFLPKNRTIDILDLGCGFGPYLYHIEAAGYKNTKGIDGSLEQVALANSLGLVNVQHGDMLTYLQQSEERFDVILLMDVLEHLTLDDNMTLLELARLRLTDSGKLIIHTPNAEGIFGMRVLYGDLTHELAFTPNSMHQLLTTVGFSTIRCYEDKPIRHSVMSSLRRLVWDFMTVKYRLLLLAETGSSNHILSQNMLTVCKF